MHLVDWLNERFSLFGVPVYWSDFIGNILALATVVLALRRLIVSWPVQIVGSICLLVASLNVHLVGNAGRQMVIIAAASWGWATWSRNRRREGAISVRWASWRARALLIGGLLGGTLAVGAVLKAAELSFYPGAPWWLVLADAWIFVGSVTAIIAQGRRWVEFWFVWVAVDLVGIPLAVSSGLYFSGIVYGLFLVLVIVGIRDWAIRSRVPITSLTGPVMVVEARGGEAGEVER